MRIAIFGGTFDPIHKAHIAVAREAADLCALDQVLVIPSANPPHKPVGSTSGFADRFRMVQLACRVDPRLIASPLEQGEEKSYSIHTIERVRAALKPDDELFFLIGADAFAEITTWHRAGDVMRLVDFIVASRPGYEYPVPQGARVHRLETLDLAVSSSEIRFRLEAGDAPDELPPPVLEYIRSEGLYGGAH